MLVYAHGNVSEFCKNNDMVIVGTYDGEIENYSGLCSVLVTDAEMGKYEYYYLKGKLLARGVELVSTRHKDSDDLSDFVLYSVQNRRPKSGGRYRFGFGAAGILPEGRVVVKRILELRDAGHTYRKIQEDPGVHHLDGRKLSISTIQIIIKNRQIYEEKGL